MERKKRKMKGTVRGKPTSSDDVGKETDGRGIQFQIRQRAAVFGGRQDGKQIAK